MRQKAGGGSSSRASSRRSAGSARAVQKSATPDAVSAEKRASYDDGGKIAQSGNSGDQLTKLGGGGGGGTGPGDGGVSEDHALPRTVPVPIKRRMTVTVVASVIVDKVRVPQCKRVVTYFLLWHTYGTRVVTASRRKRSASDLTRFRLYLGSWFRMFVLHFHPPFLQVSNAAVIACGTAWMPRSSVTRFQTRPIEIGWYLHV